MVVIRSYEDGYLTESKKIPKAEIVLKSENDSEFFYRKTEMYISFKDLYESPEGKVFCPSTGTRRAEDNECLIVIDKRSIDPEELSEYSYEGVYVTVLYGRYISDDTPACAPYAKDCDICTLKLEKTADGKIELTDLQCVTYSFERLIQEQER
ncbi:MAG: hypothetical protein ACP5QH_06075 [Thermoplasmata archaeon]